MIIGIHGPLNAGKDTVADIIQELRPNKYKRYAFASPLKRASKELFGFTDQQLEDRVLKEAVDPFWGFTPRKALQLLGTEYGRDMMCKDIWIKRAQLEITKNQAAGFDTIITDVRFENEAEWIRSRDDAVLIYIEVPNLVKDGERYAHASEVGITHAATDINLVNDKSKGFDPLYASIHEILQKLLPQGI
jgi:dephospho-CoA kinase